MLSFMEKTLYENGGCIVTWKIENFHCLETSSFLYSPYFLIGKTHKYRLCFYDNSFRLENDFLTPSNVSFSYSISITIDGSTVFQDKNERTFSSFWPDIGSFKEIDIETFPNTVVYRCYLRIISDNNLIVNQYSFRTVVEAEYRKIQYTNLTIKTFDQNLLFPSPLACSLTMPFDIKFCASESKDSLKMDITNTSKSKSDAILICKLSIADKKEKHLFTATHLNVFKKEETHVWCFPTPIIIKDLQSSNSLSENLTLDFEFLVSERKSNTWVEEFSEMPISQTKIVSESYEKNKANLRDDFMCLYIERKFTDLEIIVGGKKFPAHKTVLCARSPVFSAMFESNMLEKEKNVVEISDLDPETVDKMLFFMYSEVLEDRNWDSVTKLYVASDKYQIMTLKDKCASILIDQLSSKNACEVLHLADMHCDSDFLNAVQDFIIIHDEEILQSEEWKEFMDSHSKIACQTVHKAWIHRTKKNCKEDKLTRFA